MADGSKIEWTDATWNPITGCSVISPGCTNCYAMKLAGGRMQHHPSREGLTQKTKAGPVWTGEVRLNSAWLDQPLTWTKPRMIFVCAHGDLFARQVPDAWIDQVFAVMALAGHHTFQVLTKRADRMAEYFASDWISRVIALLEPLKPSSLWNGSAYQARHELETHGRLPNVWLGVSVEDQERAEERVPALMRTPAAVRFVSAEPLVGAIDFTSLDVDADSCMDALAPRTWGREIDEGWRGTSDSWEDDFLDWFSLGSMPSSEAAMHPTLDWVILGGESGPGARPMHPDWARQIRDDCAAADVPFFFKQWGEWVPICDFDSDAHDGRLYHPAPARDPEGRRRPKVENTTLHRDGTRHDARSPLAYAAGSGAMMMFAVGKALAGRTLGGATHSAWPEARR